LPAKFHFYIIEKRVPDVKHV